MAALRAQRARALAAMAAARAGQRPALAAVSHRRASGSAGADDEEASFGFRRVPKGLKEGLVGEVFRRVAPSYDKMNDAMSVGVHRLWKRHFVSELNAGPGTRVLDVAGGTGDIAFRVLDHAARSSTNGGGGEGPAVTVCDINAAMLEQGEARARERGDAPGSLSWVEGSAEDLPFPDESFEAYTISFGIRNVTDLDKALREAHRVLVRGGRFMCLEFSQVPNPLLRAAYDAYSFEVIPVLGEVIAKDWESYQYLVESIREFPDQHAFAKRIEAAGFKHVTHENLTGGIAAIHSGFKF